MVFKLSKVYLYYIVMSISCFQCTTTCGEGFRTRKLKCGKKKGGRRWKMDSSAKCHHVTQPNITLNEACQLPACPVAEQPFWYSSPWSHCSVTCDAGIQTRLVHCMDAQTQGLASGCPAETKPLSRRRCRNTSCPTPGELIIDQLNENSHKLIVVSVTMP